MIQLKDFINDITYFISHFKQCTTPIVSQFRDDVEPYMNEILTHVMICMTKNNVKI